MFALSLKQIIETISPLVHTQDLETITLRLVVAQASKRIDASIASELRNAVTEFNSTGVYAQTMTVEQMTDIYQNYRRDVSRSV